MNKAELIAALADLADEDAVYYGTNGMLTPMKVDIDTHGSIKYAVIKAEDQDREQT